MSSSVDSPACSTRCPAASRLINRPDVRRYRPAAAPAAGWTLPGVPADRPSGDGGARRTLAGTKPFRLPNIGAEMADKSPRQHLTKKAGKSVKEKRADKHAKVDAKNKIEIAPPPKKR